jgi:hypothetical protein
VVRLEENTLPVIVLAVHCDFFFCSSLPPPTGSYSKMEWRQRSLFPDTLYAGGRPRTTNNGEVAYCLPKRGRTVGSCGIA